MLGLWMALGLVGCTLDLTEPFLVGDGPGTLSITLSLAETSPTEGCWSVRVLARPPHRDGRLVEVADSTVRIDGDAVFPARRAHELAVFVYEQPRRCGPRPDALALEIPYLAAEAALGWPMSQLPLPWGQGADTVRVRVGEIAQMAVPSLEPLSALGGRTRLDWSARVLRAPGAPSGQEDHQLLTNFSETASAMLPLGAPFTGTAGARWEVQWAIFWRIDQTASDGRLNASLQYGVSRSSFLWVESEGGATLLEVDG
jgi:hypothetical protein